MWLRKLVVTAMAWLLYAAVFILLFPSVGLGVGALTLIVVALLGWYWGFTGGLLAGVVSFLVNAFLYGHVGVNATSWQSVVVPSIPALVIGGFVGYVKLLKLKLASQRRMLQTKSECDDLTGLLNRSAFLTQLESMVASGERNSGAVMFIDLDDFKAVNDTYGHAAGDAILVTVGRRLTMLLRPSDAIARIGGDEFALAVSSSEGEVSTASLAERLLVALNEPYLVEGLSLRLSASIGMSVYPEDGDSAQQLLTRADVALYRVKRRGKNGVGLYSLDVDKQTTEGHQLLFDLPGALRRGEFELVYQPQYSLPNENLVGFEALLRWNHPVLGQLPPAGFLSVAESTGTIVPIGAWVLEEACRQLAQWRRSSGTDVSVAVNLSATQVTDPGVVPAVKSALEKSGLPPARLELELTETVLANDLPTASRTIQELEDLGVQVALDDFGSGYSSFEFLHRLPFKKLKSDRSLVSDIGSSWQARSILRAVVSLAHELELTVVAEGVETDEEFRYVQEFGCDFVQGFLFAKALDRDAAGALLRIHSAVPPPFAEVRGEGAPAAENGRRGEGAFRAYNPAGRSGG